MASPNSLGFSQHGDWVPRRSSREGACQETQAEDSESLLPPSLGQARLGFQGTRMMGRQGHTSEEGVRQKIQAEAIFANCGLLPITSPQLKLASRQSHRVFWGPKGTNKIDTIQNENSFCSCFFVFFFFFLGPYPTAHGNSQARG